MNRIEIASNKCQPIRLCTGPRRRAYYNPGLVGGTCVWMAYVPKCIKRSETSGNLVTA